MEKTAPGVYIEYKESGARPIRAVGTSRTAFLGVAPQARAKVLQPTAITNHRQFLDAFVGDAKKSTDLSRGVHGFFLNGGGRCVVVNIGQAADLTKGLELLRAIDDVQIVAAPGMTDFDDYEALYAHCAEMGDRIAVLDAPETVDDLARLTRPGSGGGGGGAGGGAGGGTAAADKRGLGPTRDDKGHAAFYYPWLEIKDPLDGSKVMAPPSGHVAGIFARTDATRGVHKAPANEPVRGATGLARAIDNQQQRDLNENGVNVIRYFADRGILVWGARTVAPSSSPYCYVPVRRLVTMIAESIARNTRWIVFEPNDERLWKLIRRDVTAFLTSVWRDGALQGATADQAFYVKCDDETNPQEGIDRGEVVVQVGLAPIKPAEFVIFQISQDAAGRTLES
ncbi:MAG: phage tail sheath family protein [Planctomycetes bacterium]|nr:phage tail sheath family protein [Planctomycetota bacterium]